MFPIVLCAIIGISIFNGYMMAECYKGNDRACLMISDRHDITVHRR
jgi:hypothetical protein